MNNKENSTDKIERVLDIYSKLMNGILINKAEESKKYGVSGRSIQRDIDDIRNYIERNLEQVQDGVLNFLTYDRKSKGYHLEEAEIIDGKIVSIHDITCKNHTITQCDNQFKNIYNRYKLGELTILEAASKLKITTADFISLCKQEERNNEN